MALRVEEMMVAGDRDDRVQVHHLVLRGSNRAIGRHLGEIARARYGAKPVPTDQPLRVRVQREWMRRNYPAYYERMRGAAEALGLDLADDAYDLATFSPLCSAGCGMVFLPPRTTAGQRPIVSRTFDAAVSDRGAPPVTRPYVLELHPDMGHPSLSLVALDLLGAIEGMNAEGLCVAMAVDEEARAAPGFQPACDPAAGLDELRTVRYLLDSCANSLEAREAVLSVKRYWSFAPAHFLVADRHGDAFAFEPGGSLSRDDLVDAAGLPLVLTNHPLLRRPAGAGDRRDDGPAGTYARYRQLQRALAETPAPYGPEEVRAIGRVAFAEAEPRPGAEGVRTMWHAIYDLRDRSADLSFWLRDQPLAARAGTGAALRSSEVRVAMA
jgi:hypothetical protein